MSSYATTDPISVIIQDDSNGSPNVQRLGIFANAKNGWNGIWSVVADVNQVHMPSGINFSNTDV